MDEAGDQIWNAMQEAVAQVQEQTALPNVFVGAMLCPDMSVSGGEGWNMPDAPDEPEARRAHTMVAATLIGFIQAHCEQMLHEKRREFGDDFLRQVEKERLGYLNQWGLTDPGLS